MTDGQTSAQCPSCGRFVGPYDKCPYCGADVGRRMSLRAFQYGSLALAVIGLAVLLLIARRSQPPTVEIGNLVGTMNWAYVRIEGTVVRQPTYDPESQALKFWLWDGTGEILVTAYRSEAETLLAEDRVPVMGDRAAVEGTLRIKGDFQYLILNAPQNFEVQPAPAAEMTIAEALAAPLYQKVTVRGVVREERIPYAGLHIITLRDETGKIDVTLPTTATALGGDLPPLQVGRTVQVTGAVDQYKGTPQISVGRGRDVTLLDEEIAIAPERSIADLSAADVGQTVRVEGVLKSLRAFSAGAKGTLDDGTGTVTLLLWQDVYDALPEPEEVTPGAVLRIVGEVAEYRGELEVVPQVAADVAVVGRMELPVEEVAIGQISAADVGRTVQVAGQITGWELFSQGVKYTLDDGTGTITLLVWQDLYDRDDTFTKLAEGFWVRVRGEIAEYQGTLEIIPQVPADVEITQGGPIAQMTPTPFLPQPTDVPTSQPTDLPTPDLPTPTPTPTPQPTNPPAPTPTPTAETRSIGQITAADVGRTVTLAQAGVAEVAYFSKGIKYTLTDATGSITLLLWQNVVEELADRHDLFPGSQVQVVGQVDEYRGELEIVPQAGTDVVVLHRGDRPPVEERAASKITASDEGRVFIVEGTAARIEGDTWRKIWLNDGTGEILVYVPERVVAYLPAGLGVGVRLRIIGEVDIYKGAIEIIPRAGADVEIVR